MCFLLTSRDSGLLCRELRASAHDLGKPSPDAGLELLWRASGVRGDAVRLTIQVYFWRGVPPPCLTNAGNTLSPSVPTSSFQLQAECVEHASQLAAQCGYLPLALDMLGAVVRSSALGPVREFER